MRDLHTLIKMQKLYVDEQRRALAQKRAEADQVTMAIVSLQANLEMEMLKAAENGQAGEGNLLLGAFIKKEKLRHEQLQRALSAREREVEAERQKLSVLFEELKRYEIAQKSRDEEARLEAQRRETATYDEQAGQRHYKKRGET